MTPHWSEALKEIGACKECLLWAARRPDYATAWAACERGDWLLWLGARLATSEARKKRVALAAVEVAGTAFADEQRRHKRARALLVATALWAMGMETREEVVRQRQKLERKIAPKRDGTLLEKAAVLASYAADAYEVEGLAPEWIACTADRAVLANALRTKRPKERFCSETEFLAGLGRLAPLVRQHIERPELPTASGVSR